MSEVKDDVKNHAWQEWFNGLGPAARRALEREAPAPLEQEPSECLPENLGKFGFHLVIAPDVDFPYILSFRRFKDLVRQVGRFEGQDVSLFVFSGRLLPLTTGKPRYLLDLKHNLATTVPVYPNERLRRISAHLVTNPIQDNGFVGEVYSSPAPPESAHQRTSKPAPAPKAIPRNAKPTQPSSKQPPAAAPAKQGRQEPPTEATASGR